MFKIRETQPRKKRRRRRNMQRKMLEDLGLTKEQIDSIMAVNGEDIEKAKGDLKDVKEQLKAAQDTIKERDTQIEGLKKVDAEGLQAKITELQETNKQAQEKYEADLKDFKLTSAIKSNLTNAQDLDLVSNLIDKSKLILAEDGTVTGLAEQVKGLQESRPYLFKETQISGFKPNATNTNQQTAEETAMQNQINQILGLQGGK